jgi:adenylylsulfate kinase-like enzyme
VVIWIIGLAGSGKTTLGREVVAQMRTLGRSVILLDGDDVRAVTGHDLGHSPGDRAENGHRIARLCGLLGGQGFDVVACVLSNDPIQQARNREVLTDYFEVFLDTPRDVLEARDKKGLYSGAREGRVYDVVGADIEFKPPSAHFILAGDDSLAPPRLQAERIVGAALERETPRG